MSTCSAAEIAEKKRLALEKLKAKKAVGLQSKAGDRNTTASSSSHATPIPSSVPEPKENKASVFLNALKQSLASTHRQDLRKSVHPYNRPQIKSSTPDHEAGTSKPILSLTPPKELAPVFGKIITCTPYLISSKRFAVKQSAYHEQLTNEFKKIPSRYYDGKTRIWSFAVNDYNLLQKHVNALRPCVTMDMLPVKVINLCLKPPVELDYSCLASIEPALSDKLLPFQQEGVCFGIAQHGRVMICDEMGLGKTYQAIAIADFYRESWPLLICTTASTRESWANHIRTLLPTIPLHYIQVLTNNQQYFGDVKVLIMSYNMMEKMFAKLAECKFGFIIFDESHMLKNHKAKCTVVAERLAKQAKHVVLLSGTPALSRPLELFTQIRMVDPKFMNFMEFTKRYCDGKPSHFGWDATGKSNLEELNVVLKLGYMIRRTKADVLPDLAAKNRETVVLDPDLVWLSDDAKVSLNEVANNFQKSKGREREEILLRFYAITGEIKTRAVCVYIKAQLKENKKFIVFAHHRVMMNAITDCLIKANAKFIRIDGSTKNETRAEYIKTFQTCRDCKVAVLSLKACNSGITLTAAELIIFAELDWNPSTLAQAESRAHRIGQEKSVTCRYLMAHGTADDVIWNMLLHKQDTLNRAGLFCENLQNATKTTAQTSSYKIQNYFSPNKSRTSDTCLNNSTSNLSVPSDNLQTPNLIPRKISDMLPPVTNSRAAPKQDITPNNMRDPTSSSSVVSNNKKECDIFSDFFNDDDDDNAIASLKSQMPVKTIQKANNYEDLFDENDDVDLAAIRTQIVKQQYDLNKIEKYNQEVRITKKAAAESAKTESIDAFFNEDDDDDAFKDLQF